MKRRSILIQRFCQPDSTSPNIPDLYRPLPQLPESVSQRTAISTPLPIARLCLGSFRDFAFEKWHARIHEMEGTAIARVGYYNRVPIFILRALSDLAGGQSGVNQEERNSQFAASNAAEVTAKILERIESAQ